MSYLFRTAWSLLFCLMMTVLAQASSFSEIPFEEQAGLIIVKVKIGQHSYRFLFDSGASETVVSPQLARKHYWQRIGKIRITDANGNKKLLPRVRIPALSVAGYRFRRNLAHIHDFAQSDALRDLDIDGILGASLLRKAYWQIDFQRKTLKVFTDPQYLPRKSSTLFVPFVSTGEYGQPYVNLRLGQHRIRKVLVDLGYNGELELSSTRLQEIAEITDIRIFRGQTQSPSGLYGSRGQQTILLANMAQLHIGSHRVSTLAKGRPRAKAKLGTAFLRQFVITLDWKAEGMYLAE